MFFFFRFSSSLELKFIITNKIIFIKPAIPLPYSDFFSDFSDSQRNRDVKTTLDASRIVACKYTLSDKLSAKTCILLVTLCYSNHSRIGYLTSENDLVA